MVPSRRVRRHLAAVLVVAGSTPLVVACGGGAGAADPFEGLDEVGPIPVPTGDIVLTIEGDVDRPNDGGAVQTDIAGLEALGTVTVTTEEPFLDQEMSFTGVPVAVVFAAAGIDPDAPLVWTALDDYQVRYDGRAATDEDALLATRVDGTPIEIADGGPIRIVFPDDDGRLGRDTNQWIWSVRHIEAG